jgi:general secretion pathway protein D
MGKTRSGSAEQYGLRAVLLPGVVSLGLAACLPPDVPEPRPMPGHPTAQLPAPPRPLTDEIPWPGGEVAAAEPARVPMPPTIDRGTGMVVGAPPQPRSELRLDPVEDEVTLNFVEADVREVVRAVLGDMLGVPHVVDPAVTGTITVESARPLPRGQLLPLLDSVLRLNGAALVEIEGIVQVVPLADALGAGAVPELRPPSGARAFGYSVQVVPLRHVAAAELLAVLEPLQPPGGAIVADPRRNALLLAGTRGQLGTLGDLIDLLDVDWLAGMSFGLWPLRSAPAGLVASELAMMFAPEAEPRLRFVPVDRLNAVLAISPEAGWLERIGAWVERLDRGGDEEGERVYVYYVKNKRAVEVATVLQGIYAPTTVRDVAPRLAPGLEPVELMGGDGESGPAALTPLDFAAGSANLAGFSDGEVRIIADEANNAIVVKSRPRDWQTIESTLARLDILPLQVLIEATIAEVTLNDELRYGLQWFFRFGDSELRFSDSIAGAVAPAFPGFSYLLTSGDDIRVVLNALEAVTDVNVVSSPQILVLGNQSARLQVGDQVPLPVRESVSVDDPSAPIVRTFEYRDTGVILEVTPRVNPGGLTLLDIVQEVSALSPATLVSEAPIIRQRVISSSVAIQSGETVALGGLIQDDRDLSRQGLPLLSSLPVVGALFGTRAQTSRRTELLVLLTPRVIRSPEEARQVTEELRRRLPSIDNNPAIGQPLRGTVGPW